MRQVDLELEYKARVEVGVQRILNRVENERSQTDLFSPLISMVPGVLRKLNPSSFNPRAVFIGPLHREDENLQACKRWKADYVNNLLSRFHFRQKEILKTCMEKGYASVHRIKACYVWTKNYVDDAIVEMTVMDALFILAFCLRCSEPDNESHSRNMALVQTILHDLVLVENQIPLFILNEIFECTILQLRPTIAITKLLYPIISCNNLFETDIKIDNISINSAPHILGLLHQCYKPPCNIKENPFSSRIRTVVDLDKTWVNFKPNKNSQWMIGIEVKSTILGVVTIEIPVLCVADHTESVFRNLTAFEQLYVTHRYMTSYVYSMGMLVNTQEDVANLVDSGVIVNYMGSNKQVANMINNILINFTGVDSFYEEQWKTLNEYYNSYWTTWLRRARLHSPWKVIYIVVGIIPFALSVVQTIFTVKAVGNNK